MDEDEPGYHETKLALEVAREPTAAALRDFMNWLAQEWAGHRDRPPKE